MDKLMLTKKLAKIEWVSGNGETSTFNVWWLAVECHSMGQINVWGYASNGQSCTPSCTAGLSLIVSTASHHLCYVH